MCLHGKISDLLIPTMQYFFHLSHRSRYIYFQVLWPTCWVSIFPCGLQILFQPCFVILTHGVNNFAEFRTKSSLHSVVNLVPLPEYLSIMIK